MQRRTLLLSAPAIIAGSTCLAAQTLRPLNLGIIKMAALTNPWVARQRGMFERHGLNVTLLEFRAGSEAVAALQSGSTDIILSIPGTAMTAIERGFDLRAIFQNEVAKREGPDSGSIQVAANSPIRKLSDLAGKRIAVSQLHSQNTVGVQQLLKNAGVALSGVQLLELPFPTHADALKNRQVDAVVTVDPYTTQLQASGVGRVISWNYVESIPGQPLGAWFAKGAFINRSPEVVEGFTRALRESIDYMNADPARARAEVVAFTGLDAKLVADMPHVGWSYQVDVNAWQQVVDMMRANGELRRAHKATDFMAEQIKPYLSA